MTDPNVQAAPGWYPDPYREAPLRWWNGGKWEAHVAGGGPVAWQAAASARARRPLAPGTPVYTLWIWLVVAVPLVSVLITLAFNPIAAVTQSLRSLGDPSNPALPNIAAISTPGYLISVALGWVVYGLGAVFAWLDYRELQRRGVDRPFHWAWSFLLLQLYSIARSVIVRRVSGGRGVAPIWATIAVIVIGLVAGTALVVMIIVAVLQSVGDASSIGA